MMPPPRAAMGVTAAAVIVIVFATRQITYQQDFSGPVVVGLWMTLPGILLLWGALALARPAPVTDEVAVIHPGGDVQPRWPHRAAVVLALVLQAAQIEINGGFLRSREPYPVPSAVQLVMLVAACLLFIWGFSTARWTLPRWRSLSRSARLTLIGVGLLTVIAIILRLHRLELLRAFVDEGHFIVPTQRFASEPTLPLLRVFSPSIAFPYLYPYLQSLAKPLHESPLVWLRIPSAIVGGLTVPALYLLARQLFDRPTAFAAAGLLATLPIHLQLSRLGMNNAADPLFGVLAFGLLARGVRRGGRWHFAAAGVCLGLTQYFYEGGRLLYPALMLIWGAASVLLRWKRPSVRDLLVLALTAGVVALPIYTTLYATGFSAARRLEMTHIMLDAPAQFWERLSDTLCLFLHRPEPVAYYTGDGAYLPLYMVPLLLLGFGVLVWRWRTAGALLTLAWSTAVPVAIALIIFVPHAARVLNVFPALMMVCAVGAVEVARLLVGGRRWLSLMLVTGCVAAIVVLNGVYYFGVHIDRFTRQHYWLMPEQEIVFHALTLPDDTQAYYLSSAMIRQRDLGVLIDLMHPGITFEMGDMALVPAFVAFMPVRQPTVIYVPRHDAAVIALLRQRFHMRGPYAWPHIYASDGIEYVIYVVSADKYAEIAK